MNCPHCHKQINVGAVVVRERWKKLSKQERKAATEKARQARWNKKPASPRNPSPNP